MTGDQVCGGRQRERERTLTAGGHTPSAESSRKGNRRPADSLRKASALTSGSGKVALREGSAGAGFEVLLETHRAALIGEFHRDHEPPWTMVGRVDRVSPLWAATRAATSEVNPT